MKDLQLGFTLNGTPIVKVSTDGFGRLHILIGHEQVDRLVDLLNKNKVVHNVDLDAGTQFANVEIGGEITEDDLQAILDSID